MTRLLPVHLGLVLVAAGCAPPIEAPITQAVTTALFDPSAAPPVLPLPNDLARDPATGLLTVSDDGANPTQVELNAYLRTLDGFPSGTPVTAAFDAALDPTSVIVSTLAVDGSVAVLDVTAQLPLSAADYTPSLSSDGKTLTITPHLADALGVPAPGPWKLGHQYAVILFGGDDPNGLRGADGTPVVGSPATFYLRSERPALTACADQDPLIATPACLCPLAADGLFAADCHPATGLTSDEAALIEARLRRPLGALLDQLLPVAGPRKSRDDVALVWSFTVAHGPFAVFDPAQQKLPFPSDALVDPKTGKLNIPAPAGTGAALGALYAGLATLDGFSTTGDVTVPIDEDDDNFNASPVGVVAGKTAHLFNLAELAEQPTYGAGPELINGGQDFDGVVALHPTQPLRPDRARYLGVLTNGITDGKGRPLRPSPLMAMLMLTNPLVDETMRSTLPGLLSDAAAAQLEPLRAGYAASGLWTNLPSLLGVEKDQVAMLFTFGTQSMTETLRALDAYPAKAALTTAVTVIDHHPLVGVGPDVGQAVYGTLSTHLALTDGGKLGATLDLAGGSDAVVPFLLILPAHPPTGGAPVAIVHHGLYAWRGAIVGIAQAFAARGWAVIGIDANFHGARSACTDDSQCAAGGTCDLTDGTCSTSLAIKCQRDAQCAASPAGSLGKCNTSTGLCSTRLAPESDLCLTHASAGASVTECNPSASGQAFLSLANPFSIRDNLRQDVLDLAQLERVIGDGGPGGLRATLAALDPTLAIDETRHAYLGQSLGGIEGALFLSVDPDPSVGVLNAPAGNLVDALAASPQLSPLLSSLLSAAGVADDTASYDRLINLYRLVLDPGDPINFGRYLRREPFAGHAPRSLVVQEAGQDQTLPNAQTDQLVTELGLPTTSDGRAAVVAKLLSTPSAPPQLVSTFFPAAGDGFLLGAEPSTAAGQQQAVTFIVSEGNLITPSVPAP